MMAVGDDDNGLPALRASVRELHHSIEELRRERNKPWTFQQPVTLEQQDWNFRTFSIYINQRFSDLSLQLQQRFEAQQAGVTTAMIAAEKAVNSALTAAEKAVDKAEQAQALRNEAQNEFRKSLSDLSGLMWTIREGTQAVDALRKELEIRIKASEETVQSVKSTSDNLQGRLAMIGIVWGIVVVVASAAIRWFH